MTASTVSTQKRKTWSIALGAGFLLLLLGLAALNAFQLSFLNPATIGEVILFTALSGLAFVLFVAVLLMLVRNVLKLYADQRSRVMGSRLRIRMLWGAVLVSLVPISFMFCFSYLLMNRAVDRWFSQPVTQMRDDSNAIAVQLREYAATNARVEADSLAAELPAALDASRHGQTAPGKEEGRAAAERLLRSHRITLQGGFAAVFVDGRMVAEENLPAAPASTSLDSALAPALLLEARKTSIPLLSLAGADYVLGVADVLSPGAGSFLAGGGQGATLPAREEKLAEVVVGLPLPVGMSATMARLRAASEDYWTLMRARRSVRSTYMILLLMMTSLALFASSWLALYLSKQVTKPVEALADAMASIAAGDYKHRVEASATEELGELIRSFNGMAQDLEGSRAQVQASTDLLSAANHALETRRRELETMLETIPNGVATLSADRRILSANRALGEMIDPGGQRPILGQRIETVFPTEVMEPLERLLRRSHRMGSASGEMEMAGLDGPQNLLATVAILERMLAEQGLVAQPPDGAAVQTLLPRRTHETFTMREHMGYVLVLENATELLRAQKQSAWREVARRVAHEIKNPLTPIALNAEQIGRHIERIAAKLDQNGIEAPSVAVIRRASEGISGSVESMRGLVDQFAALAQFPATQPQPADLNTIVENSLSMFAGRTQGVRVIRRLVPGLPPVLADPEAMKRALGNIIDNAVEAMQDSLLRELRVETSLLEIGMVELTISDTGSGLTDEMRERLFLPYFSTKQRGTGLGLAIAAKIIQESGGSVRAEQNEPAGARFIAELKLASDPAAMPLDQDSVEARLKV